MCTFKRINRRYIITYNNVEYEFAQSKFTWALIFAIKKEKKITMFEKDARQLAYAVLLQAVKDYVSGNYDRAKILRELRRMGTMGKLVANRLEFHLDEVAENMNKELFEFAI